MTDTVETTVFRHLRDSEYPAKSFDTGHPAYDRYLAAVQQWQPNWSAFEGTTVWGYTPREVPDARTREVVLREMPFVAAIEAEPAESVGRAMLINAYAVPRLSPGWHQHPLELADKVQFAQKVFYAFTRELPHARLSADDAEAFLREIPESLFEDELFLFTALFFRSFEQLPPSLERALNDFVDGFFVLQGPWGVLVYNDSADIIERHLKFMSLLGRAPESLPFYRERSRVFEIARQQAAYVLPELGSLHARYFAVTENGKYSDYDLAIRRKPIHQAEVRSLQATIDQVSPSERGRMVADQSRALLAQFGWNEADRWRSAGLPFQLSNLRVPQLEHLVDQVEREMQLTPEQACIVLKYMALHGSKWASNYPTLSYRVAQTLAKCLPTARPDLECLVKDTTYQTDEPTKELLLDALRGEQRGAFENSSRRLLWKLLNPPDRSSEMWGALWGLVAREDKVEMWDEWIAEKRRTLLAEIDKRPPVGRAAPCSADVPDWGSLNGQLYDLDVVGYAKRIARAQSAGANVSVPLQDLQRLAAMARENLSVLEASVEADAIPLAPRLEESASTVAIGKKPSLFGLQAPPTGAQLVDCERRTLAALDALVTRIALLQRCPGLVPFEYSLRNPSKSEPQNLSEQLFRKAWIDARMQNGVPDGVVRRVDGINPAIVEGPYLFDTEPSFAEAEFNSWRGAIWALSHIPQTTAIAALQRVAAKCFATSLRPNHEGWNYARQGYRAEELGKAVIWALEKLPGKAGLPALSDLCARAYPQQLRESLREAIKRVESGEAERTMPGFMAVPEMPRRFAK